MNMLDFFIIHYYILKNISWIKIIYVIYTIYSV